MPTRTDQPPFQPAAAQSDQAPAQPVAPVVSILPPAEQARNAELQEKARALREAPRAVPITDVAIVIGIRTKEGRQEQIIDIGSDFRILECTQNMKEKVRAVTEDGQFLGYEPTGECEFTLKVKYLKE